MQGKSLPGRYPATKDKNSMMGLPMPLDKWRTLPNKRMALDFAAMEERNARLAPLNPAMFAGAEWVIQYESSRLSQYKQDLIISIAMASGSSIKTTIDNLETIDLPLTAGVIIILDQLHTIDTDWYVVLLKALVKLEKSGKFVFVEAVHTTNRPLKDILPKALMSEVDKINAEEKAKFASAGYRIGGSSTLVNYQAVREQARLIIKYLQCKYVFWIDADVRLPHDTIGRLSKLIESGPNVGMAAGWYLNRHVSFEYPSFDSAVQCEPENEEERRYYERVFAFFQDIAFSGILPPGSKIPGCGFSIAPQRIRSSKEPLEMACAGYGCIMLKKEVNDRFSHLSIHDGYIWTEDLTVCIGARKAGHKLMVDPTCYCEHLG